MTHKRLPGGYPSTFYLVSLASFLFFSSSHLLVTPLPLYIEAIGGQATEVGLATGSFAVAAIIARPFMGRLTDTRGRKPMLIFGAIMFIIGPLSYILARSIGLLLAARMFHGIGIAAFTTAYFALIADVTPPSRWGEAFGLAGAAPGASIIIASPLGTSLIGRVSFAAVFSSAALMALCSLVIVLMLREPAKVSVVPQSGNPKEETLLSVVRLRGVWAPSLATVIAGLTYGGIFTFLPLFARDRQLGNVGFFFTVSSTVVILARFYFGRVSDRIGRVSVILPMFVVLGLSMAGLNWTYSFSMLVLIALINGLGFGAVRVGLDTMVVDNAPGAARGTALGILYLCFDGGIGAGSVVTGVLADLTGYGNVYLLVGIVCVLATAFFAPLMRRPRPT